MMAGHRYNVGGSLDTPVIEAGKDPESIKETAIGGSRSLALQYSL